MDDRTIQQFVDGLVDIRGFEFEATAVTQDEPGEDSPEGFVVFSRAGLSLWVDHWRSEHEALTLALLETEHRRRLFVGQDHETPQEFTHRIRTEARAMQDPWLFVSVQGRAAIGRAFDMSRAEERARASRSGLMQDAALWYAEARGRGVVDSGSAPSPWRQSRGFSRATSRRALARCSSRSFVATRLADAIGSAGRVHAAARARRGLRRLSKRRALRCLLRPTTTVRRLIDGDRRAWGTPAGSRSSTPPHEAPDLSLP